MGVVGGVGGISLRLALLGSSFISQQPWSSDVMNDFLSSSHPAIVAGTLQACKKGEGRGCRKVEVVEMEDGVLKVCIAA